MTPEEEARLAELEAKYGGGESTSSVSVPAGLGEERPLYEAIAKQIEAEKPSYGLTPEEEDRLAYLEAKYAPERERTASERVGGSLLSALDGATYGLASHVGAAGSAALDFINPFNERDRSYSDWLNVARRGKEDFREANPYVAPGLEIAGALASPSAVGKGVTTLLGQGASFGGKVGRAALTGAGEGALYAGITQEGDLRDKAEAAYDAAKWGGLLGGGFSAAGQGVGATARGLKRAGKNRKMSSVGITKPAMNRVRDSKGGQDYFNYNEGKNYLEHAFERLDADGEFAMFRDKNGKGTLDLTELALKADQRTGELEKKIAKVLKEADKKVGSEVDINWAHVEHKVLDSTDIPTYDFEKAKKEINKVKEGWYSRETRNLSAAHNEKMRVAKQAKLYRPDKLNAKADPIKEVVHKQVANEFRKLVENEVDNLPISEGAKGFVRDTNDKIKSWLTMKEYAFMPNAANDVNDGSGVMSKLFSTTGAGTVAPVAAAAVTGNPLWAIPGAYNVLQAFPAGKYATYKGLDTASKSLSRASKVKNIGGYLGYKAQDSSSLEKKPVQNSLEQKAATNAKAITPSTNNINVSIPQLYHDNDMTRSKFLKEKYGKNINKLEQKVNMDVDRLPNIIKAIIAQESAFNPKAVSPKGAKGLMQIMPFWETERAQKVVGYEGSFDPFDPTDSVRLGTAILADEMKRFKGNVPAALAAYNAGGPAVQRAIRKAGSDKFDDFKHYLPVNKDGVKENLNYVLKVMKNLKMLEKEEQDDSIKV